MLNITITPGPRPVHLTLGVSVTYCQEEPADYFAKLSEFSTPEIWNFMYVLNVSNISVKNK